jgi:Protochlamydia outer membrane protein
MMPVKYIRAAWLVLGLFPATVLLAEEKTDVSLSLGYRTDSLDWNISGENNPVGTSPNILSELEWRELDILQLKAEVMGSNRAGVVVRGNAGYGWVLDGVNQDSDYAGSNRTLEFSRSVNDVEGSRVLDLSGGLGFLYYPGETAQFRLIPMLGYSYHSQKLQMNNGNQVLWNSSNASMLNPALAGWQPLGPFPGLDSSYDAQWSGPWVGTDVVWDLASGSTLYARAEAHWINYTAQANWNLRTDFAQPVSFEHEANGRGSVLELGWKRLPSHTRWGWGMSLVLQSWATESGIDSTFFASGGVAVTKLNEVNWSSRSINLSLQKSFLD